jgi:hypothetical protein
LYSLALVPSRNWYRLADPERITGLVSNEHQLSTRFRALPDLNPEPPDYESGELTTTLFFKLNADELVGNLATPA